MADTYTFKVFSGPHNGLVFDLKPGKYKVGKGIENDLIFSDEEMGSSAAEIEVTPLEITVSLNDKAQLDGQPVEPGQHKWESGSFILLGDTLISYRASSIKGPWAKPAFAQAQSATGASPAKDQVEDNSGAATPEDGDDSQKTAALTEDESSDKTAAMQSAAEYDRRSILMTIFSAVLLLLLLVGLMFGSSLFFKENALEADLEVLTKAIEDNGFNDLNAEIADGIIELHGSVESQSGFAKLVKILPELNSTLNLDVEVRDDEILGVERDFSALGYYVRAHYLEDGKIGVDGYMADAYVQAEAFNAMEPRYKDRLRGRIVYRSELESELKANCLQLGIHNVQLVLGKGRVYYKGKTTLEDENALETARYKTAEKLGIPLLFTRYDPMANASVERLEGTETVELNASTDEKETSLSEALPPAPVRPSAASVPAQKQDELEVLSVTMKPMRFITLKNGRKYFEGGVLPSGYVVSSIDLKKVVLTKGNEVKELLLK